MGDTKAILRANVDALCERRYGRRNIRRLAADAGIGNGSAQRIFEGETAIGLDVLERVADLFGVTPADLITPNLGVSGQSVMASTLAAALDQVADPVIRRRVWALCMLVVDQQDLPEPTAAPALAPSVAQLPGRS